MGLKQLIGEEFRGTTFGEARTGAKALEWLSKRQWQVLIVDIDLPDQNGFSVLSKIYAHHAPARSRVLMMSMHADPLHAARARQLGASGYVSKSSNRAELVRAISNVLANQKDVGPPLSRNAVPVENAAPHEQLSPRELLVMLALARGKRIGEIASELSLNIKTVSTYKRRVLNKLKLRSTAGLVRYAIHHKLA